MGEEKLLYFADKIMNLCTRKELKRFDGFVPIDPDIYNENDNDIIFTDATSKALNGTVNISAYRPGIPDGETSASRAGQILKLKSLSAKEMRKKTGTFAINPYQLEVCFENYPHIADGFLQEVNGKFKYLEVGGHITQPKQKSEAIISSQILMGIQFNIENQCSVYLRPENAEFGFRYPLQSLGQVKELFRLRDIPDGYKRRVALKHWVAKHMRRKPSNPDELVEVRRHLRGRQDFTWFGISGTIFVNE